MPFLIRPESPHPVDADELLDEAEADAAADEDELAALVAEDEPEATAL